MKNAMKKTLGITLSLGTLIIGSVFWATSTATAAGKEGCYTLLTRNAAGKEVSRAECHPKIEDCLKLQARFAESTARQKQSSQCTYITNW